MYEQWICRDSEEQMHSHTDNKFLRYNSLLLVTQAQEHKSYSRSLLYGSQGAGFNPQRCNICAVQLWPFCRTMLEFFPWVFLIFCIYLHGRILKINPGLCRLHWEFNFGCPCVWWRSWLRHCATSQKVTGSIPDGVIGIFH